jgi:hypothetical protein
LAEKAFQSVDILFLAAQIKKKNPIALLGINQVKYCLLPGSNSKLVP